MTPAAIDMGRMRRNFTGHSEDYNRYARVQKVVVANLLELLEGRVGLSGPVLEVGTGTGDLASRVLERWPNLELVVSDVAHGMTRAARNGLPGVAALDADVQALPLCSHSFGAILSTSVFQWVNDLSLAFSECARVLADGGLFAFALFGERTLWELRECHRLALQATGRNTPSHVQSFPTEEAVAEAIASAGLNPLHLSSGFEVETHDDVSTLLRSLKKIGAQNAHRDKPRGLTPRAVMAQLDALYNSRYRTDGGLPATYHVIYCLASK